MLSVADMHLHANGWGEVQRDTAKLLGNLGTVFWLPEAHLLVRLVENAASVLEFIWRCFLEGKIAWLKIKCIFKKIVTLNIICRIRKEPNDVGGRFNSAKWRGRIPTIPTVGVSSITQDLFGKLRAVAIRELCNVVFEEHTQNKFPCQNKPNTELIFYFTWVRGGTVNMAKATQLAQASRRLMRSVKFN